MYMYYIVFVGVIQFEQVLKNQLMPSQNSNTSAFTDFFPNWNQEPLNWESRSTKCSDWKFEKLDYWIFDPVSGVFHS